MTACLELIFKHFRFTIFKVSQPCQRFRPYCAKLRHISQTVLVSACLGIQQFSTIANN